MDRRRFLKQTSLAGTGLLALPAMAYPGNIFRNFNLSEQPAEIQKTWMDLKFGLYIHFGINTYYDKEWSDGMLDPYRFDPGLPDTDNWCQTARDAGMKYVVLVAKHHDGFCLWPSRHSDYTVARSQYTRDIIAAITSSAEKFGLKVGLSYSLWDRHMSDFIADDWEFISFIKNQLTELLTNYGPLVELRFDGFWNRQQSGWSTKPEEIAGGNPASGNEPETMAREELDTRNEEFIYAWRMEGAYRWQMDYLYNYIKSLQPDCIVLNNSGSSYPGVPLFPVDARTGERYTNTDANRQIWPWTGKNVFVPLQIETTMSTQGNQRFPQGNWFWHAWDHSVLTDEEVMALMKNAAALNANLLLNIGPDKRGRLRPEDIRTLSEIGK